MANGQSTWATCAATTAGNRSHRKAQEARRAPGIDEQGEPGRRRPCGGQFLQGRRHRLHPFGDVLPEVLDGGGARAGWQGGDTTRDEPSQQRAAILCGIFRSERPLTAFSRSSALRFFALHVGPGTCSLGMRELTVNLTHAWIVCAFFPGGPAPELRAKSSLFLAPQDGANGRANEATGHCPPPLRLSRSFWPERCRKIAALTCAGGCDGAEA